MNDAIMHALLNAFPIIVPEAILGLAACLLFLGGTIWSGRRLWATAAMIGLAAASIALYFFTQPSYAPASDELYATPLVIDQLAVLTKIMAWVAGAVVILFSWTEVPDRQAADYYACLLIIVAGLGLTGAANDLITLFVALELISIPTYVILYLPRHDAASQEAAMKYFLLSIFSSAMLLFGFSYLYGLAGTTNLPAIISALAPGRDVPAPPAIMLVALIMIVAGLCFRITAVPFHYYAPDVYQGAPTSVAAVLAFMPKVAGFVGLIRLLGFVRADVPGSVLALGPQVPVLFWILAAVTMSLGNLLALLQNNVKRLLAYSGVAHAGYMLVGLAVNYPLIANPRSNTLSGPMPGGVGAILFYLVAYGAMTVGAFAVLTYLSTPERPVETEDDLAGLGETHPGVAFCMAVFLLSLIGIPATAGFAGKVPFFAGALSVQGENGRLFMWLAIVMAVNTAIGAWYYLRILSKMYLQSTAQPLPPRRSWAGLSALGICVAVTFLFGCYPELLSRQTSRALSMPAPVPGAEARVMGE